MKMKKDSLVVAIGKMKPKDMKQEDDMEDSDDSESEVDEGLESAFDDLVTAIKSEDSKAGVEALKAFIDQCYADHDEEESEDDESDDEDSASGF